MRLGLMRLRGIPEVGVLAALLGACASTPPPASPTAEKQYWDFRVLSDSEKRIISRGALKGLKDARIKWPQFPNSTDTSVAYCALINAKGSGGVADFKPYAILVTQSGGTITEAALDTTDRGADGVAEFCQRKGINLAEVS
jgi:hypothetical protein